MEEEDYVLAYARVALKMQKIEKQWANRKGLKESDFYTFLLATFTKKELAIVSMNFYHELIEKDGGWDNVKQNLESKNMLYQ